MEKIQRRDKTRKRRVVDQKNRRAQQRDFQKNLERGIGELVRESFEQTLQDEVTELLGRAKGQRRDLTDQQEVAASCNRCQGSVRSRFYRAGYYPRSLLTSDLWLEIKAPRLSCVCGGMVDFEFRNLEPYGRIWFELEERARELAGVCVSLRDSVRVLAWRNDQPLSIATLNSRVNQTADLALAFHQGQFERVPPVVLLDGVWLKVLLPTEEEYLDKCGRRRKRNKLRKLPLLVAYGVDPVSQERFVIDWERGESEDQASWQSLLERLLERGLCAQRGLRLFVHDGSAGLAKAFEMVYFGKEVLHQRCIFHKLRNVQRDVEGSPEMARKERRARRQEVLREATEVYRGKDESEIKRRLEGFRSKWAEREPKAVATLERDFEETLAYLRAQERARQEGQAAFSTENAEWQAQSLRTTSPLERVQRQFRQKMRQVVIAHSERGVEAIIELVIRHRGLASPGPSSELWSRQLEEALLNV